MFYDDLKKYTEILRSSSVKHDSNFDDVVESLTAVENTKVKAATSPVGERSRTVTLTITNPHGSFTLRYRYSSDFFLTLMCHVVIDGVSHPVRWWDDYEKFTYHEAEHQRVVYDFMRAVSAGF